MIGAGPGSESLGGANTGLGAASDGLRAMAAGGSEGAFGAPACTIAGAL